MSTIAQDYAAELRRIADTLAIADLGDDAEELRLAAEYLEQSATGVALRENDVESRLSPRERMLIQRCGIDLLDRQDAAFRAAVRHAPENRGAFLDGLTLLYLTVAAVVAVSRARPEEKPLGVEDFLATAHECWTLGLVAEASIEARLDATKGGRA